MLIKVKYYGLVAEAIGLGTEEMECLAADGDDLRAFFIRRYPQLRGLTWKVAVDLELIDGPIQLRAGSEIVLLPPFAGG